MARFKLLYELIGLLAATALLGGLGIVIIVLYMDRQPTAVTTPAVDSHQAEDAAFRSPLELHEPSSGQVATQNHIQISGRSQPTTPLLILNDQFYRVVTTDARGYFVADVDLTPGVNLVSVSILLPDRLVRMKNVPIFYLPNITIANGEQIIYGVVTYAAQEKITFASLSGVSEGQLVESIPGSEIELVTGTNWIIGTPNSFDQFVPGQSIVVIGREIAPNHLEGRVYAGVEPRLAQTGRVLVVEGGELVIQPNVFETEPIRVPLAAPGRLLDFDLEKKSLTTLETGASRFEVNDLVVMVGPRRRTPDAPMFVDTLIQVGAKE